jgi:hypothetical protein
LPGQLEARLADFVAYYNTRRYHESLSNLTPADFYFDRAQTILTRRQKIKLKTIELRRRLHHQAAPSNSTQMGPTLSYFYAQLVQKVLTTYAYLALLSLLLWFTFSMSLSKHERRMSMVVADSNSIGDFYTCAGLLTEPIRTKLRTVVRQYAVLHLNMARQRLDRIAWENALRSNDLLQSEMANLVSAPSAPAPQSPSR